MRIAGLIEFKSGDAISGIVSRRLPWFRFLRVENCELHEASTQTTTRADGTIWVPKSNVLFLQQLQRVDTSPLPTKVTLPGPLTSLPSKNTEA
jgi:hypothetical protein